MFISGDKFWNNITGDGYYVRANGGEAGREYPAAMGFYQRSGEVWGGKPVWINENGYKLYYRGK